MRTLIIRTVKTTLGFTLLGPLFGGLPYLILMYLPARGSDGIDTVLSVGFFAYLFGAVPALVTGVVAGVLAPRLSRGLWYLAAAVIGLVTAAGFGAWMSGSPMHGSTLEVSLLIMGTPGLIGGFLSAWSLVRLGVVRRAHDAH